MFGQKTLGVRLKNLNCYYVYLFIYYLIYDSFDLFIRIIYILFFLFAFNDCQFLDEVCCASEFVDDEQHVTSINIDSAL